MDNQVVMSHQKIKVAIDPGTSLVKVLYNIDDGLVELTTMGAEYVSLPEKKSKFLPLGLNPGNIQTNSWIKLRDDDRCHLLGHLAESYSAFINTKKPKVELLQYKILGILGAIVKRESLSKGCHLELGLLIPYNEIDYLKRDSDWIDQLEKRLFDFSFQDSPVSFKLEKIEIKPEGYGIFKQIRSTSGGAFENKNTAVIMLGYRNTTCLFYRRGSLDRKSSATSMFGYHFLLSSMRQEIPYLDEKSILKSIKTIADDSSTYLPEHGIKITDGEAKIDFAGLVQGVEIDKRKSEIPKLKDIYSESLEEYWSVLRDWLDQKLPLGSEIDQMVFCGGSYSLLQERLIVLAKEYESKIMEDKWSDELPKYLLSRKSYHLYTFKQNNFKQRFADIWGYFSHLSDYDKTRILNVETGRPPKNN